MKIELSPSILSADLARLPEQVQACQQTGTIERLHIDVMDGHFVPNLTFGPAFVKSLSKVTSLWQEVHLMVTNPEKFIEPFALAGAQLIMFHVEVTTPINSILQQIKQAGKKAGLVVKPNTLLNGIEKWLPEIDLLLIMTVEPGFGGQPFMHVMLDKVKVARKMINQHNPHCDLEVDGGIDAATAPLAVQAGANVLVAGNAIFGSKQPVPEAIAAIQAACRIE